MGRIMITLRRVQELREKMWKARDKTTDNGMSGKWEDVKAFEEARKRYLAAKEEYEGGQDEDDTGTG